MSGCACKIAVTGAHSTGKSTFLMRLQRLLEDKGVRVGYVHEGAQAAQALGFKILEGHTFESTAWIMARTMELEAVVSRKSEIVLVDRPVPDALGYLVAALRHTGRDLETGKEERLERICASWVGEYDLLFMTELDLSIPLGAGRDIDGTFRVATSEAIEELLARIAPKRIVLRQDQLRDSLNHAVDVAMSKLRRV